VFVLSISSLKGGVGKTTVALGLASAAWARGLRTLVVDLDPQADVSTGLNPQARSRVSVADVLTDPTPENVRNAIVPSGWKGGAGGTVDLMLGSPAAISLDSPQPSVREIWRLEEALALIEPDYDLVVIDCPPSLNALTRTGWAASDRVVMVTEPGLFSVAAADRGLRALDELRRAVSPRLQPLGIVVNRARMQSVEHQFRIRELREMFGPLVLPPFLPERTALQQAQGAAKPVHEWPGDSAQEVAEIFDRHLDRVIRTFERQDEDQSGDRDESAVEVPAPVAQTVLDRTEDANEIETLEPEIEFTSNDIAADQGELIDSADEPDETDVTPEREPDSSEKIVDEAAADVLDPSEPADHETVNEEEDEDEDSFPAPVYIHSKFAAATESETANTVESDDAGGDDDGGDDSSNTNPSVVTGTFGGDSSEASSTESAASDGGADGSGTEAGASTESPLDPSSFSHADTPMFSVLAADFGSSRSTANAQGDSFLESPAERAMFGIADDVPMTRRARLRRVHRD